ncbi:MAG TPA: di-heme oxidoredictase family protein [Thermoanaerobaculia bacterium]|nr:di-heme oxidoredictase family protein [Thermoanaerobaculia bacterium]
MKTTTVTLLIVLSAMPLFAQRQRTIRGNPVPDAGDPLAGLTAPQTNAFNDGKTEFSTDEEVDEGLGPVFNGRSCAECHRVPATGGGSRRTVTRFGRLTNGVFDPLTQFGGSLIQERAIGPRDGSTHAFQPERVPPAANVVARRRSTPLFGLGLVDATPDSAFQQLAAEQAARNDGTAGRVSIVDNIVRGGVSVGKFGWKAQVPTLQQFSGDAYLNEMGITSPLFPNENCPGGNCAELAFNPVPALNDLGDDVAAIANYMTFLAAPPRGAITADVTAGEAVFRRIGCESCHTSTLRTGRSDVSTLDRKEYHPWSDYLLHDMGALGDNISQGAANGREMRTAPLWGLRFVETYLHDGRANTVEQAIGAHDGQGLAARDQFNALDPRARAQLMAFLRSL